MASGIYHSWNMGLFSEFGKLNYVSSSDRPPPENLECRRSMRVDPFCYHGDHLSIRASEDSCGRRLAASPNQELYERSSKVSYGRRLLHSHVSSEFIPLLRACAKKKDLHEGTRLHKDLQRRGLIKECSDELVILYAKCGDLTKAEELLSIHSCKSVFCWNSLIAAYARKGRGLDALNCFRRMQHEGVSPNGVTFTGLLKACGSMRAIDKGQQFHDEIARQGFLEKDVVLGNALVDMYAKCGALAKAHRVLEELPSRDVISWNTLIAGYAQDGQGEQAFSCFGQMHREGISPDRVTFTCILKVCGMLGASEKGEWIHDQLSRRGILYDDTVLGTAVVDMYAKCGAFPKAKQVLEKLLTRDVVAWNALMVGYAQHDQGEEALKCYKQMQNEGLSPDAVTFSCILKACGSIGVLEQGEQFHREISRNGLLGNNVVVGNALVGMYVKCNALDKAKRVLEELPFRDVVTWNTYMTGLIQEGQGEQVLACFESMKNQGMAPNQVTFACALKACALLGALERGAQIYNEISGQGLLGNNMLLATAVVDMYAKCGALAKAAQVLHELPFRDTVTWNALIAGYAQEGLYEQVLRCFTLLQSEHLSPDGTTFLCVLNACSHLGLVEDGFMFFKLMSIEYGIKQDKEHFTCMIDLFGRSGHLDKAAEMIQNLPSADDSAVWSALLDACGKWGDVNIGRWALKHAVLADEIDGAAYVLMSNVQATAGLEVGGDTYDDMRMEESWQEGRALVYAAV